MFFLGIQIQRDEHGTCALSPHNSLPFNPLSCKHSLNASSCARPIRFLRQCDRRYGGVRPKDPRHICAGA